VRSKGGFVPSVKGDRPSLREWSLFAVGWHACTWLGWGLVAWSLIQLGLAAVSAMGPPFAMVAALVVLSELRPVVMTRLVGNPVSFSSAFVFASLYMWGLYPAVVLLAVAVVISESLRRKALWKLLFNVGQYTLSLASAWLVMVAVGNTPTPLSPSSGLLGRDLPWIIASWLVYHLVNLALVACLASDDGQTWRESFTDEFWFYTAAAVTVLSLSPLIAIVAQSYPGSWVLLPLLLLPLLAVQQAARMFREHEWLALHDPLTGLPNRVLLDDRLQQTLAQSERLGGDVVVLFLDIDHFKVVNDSLGHLAGDELLGQMADRLRSVVRPSDTLARFGGDEFVLVCQGVTDGQADDIADRIRSAIAEPYLIGGREVIATASIGIVVADSTADAQTLLRDADAAMYQAKAAGGARSLLFHAAMHRQAADRLDFEAGLRHALQDGELLPYYQPIIDLESGMTVGVEALIRWQHPQKGLLDPGMFLPMAEETGLIRKLGRVVLTQALTQVASWQNTTPYARLSVAVNLSATELDDASLPSFITHTIQTVGLPASALSLEITESSFLNTGGPSRDSLDELRSQGVTIAIDDFGTGYSSLSYLGQLPVTTLKLDRSFVSLLGDRYPNPTSIAGAITNLASALNLDVIAEGVETPEQLKEVLQLGIKRAQGYLWSMPLSAPDLDRWLETHRASTAARRHAADEDQEPD
jgi:diguanylate cyclase (GGDEF)-like protein